MADFKNKLDSKSISAKDASDFIQNKEAKIAELNKTINDLDAQNKELMTEITNLNNHNSHDSEKIKSGNEVATSIEGLKNQLVK